MSRSTPFPTVRQAFVWMETQGGERGGGASREPPNLCSHWALDDVQPADLPSLPLFPTFSVYVVKDLVPDMTLVSDPQLPRPSGNANCPSRSSTSSTRACSLVRRMFRAPQSRY